MPKPDKRLVGKRVTAQLGEQFRRASRREQAWMIDTLERLTQGMRHARAQRPEPGSVAYSAHHEMTVWIAKAVDNPPPGHAVQCRRGCSHCCRLQVAVIPDEAELVVMAANDAGLEIDRERLQRQAAAANVEQWRQLPIEDRACVFLRDGECAIYDHRPGTCRKYMVATPAELCDTERHAGGEVGILASAMAEIIQSAAFTVFGEANLAPAVLAVLTRRDSDDAGPRSL